MSAISFRARLADRARKAASVLGREGIPGLARLFYDAACMRVRGLMLRFLVPVDAKSSRASILRSQHGRGLFIDCGSNLGQGFGYFRKYYPLDLYDYVLVEPNPHCLPKLAELQNALAGNIEIIGKAAGTGSGETGFYGLSEGRLGKTSELGSTLPDHNSKFYETGERNALLVGTFSLSEFIGSRRAAYCTIVLKLDIEGGEHEVLEDMLSRKTHLSWRRLHRIPFPVHAGTNAHASPGARGKDCSAAATGWCPIQIPGVVHRRFPAGHRRKAARAGIRSENPMQGYPPCW